MTVHPSYPPELVRRQVDADREGRVGAPVVGERPVVVADPDPAWASWFEDEAARIVGALGDVVVRLEHIGSTAVPGLPAKPVVDMDLQVADSADEDAYVPALEAAGYRLALREPWWNGHRMLVGPGGRSHLHVFPAGAPEPLRHLLFRDWLRTHPDDRDLYAATKRDLAVATAADPERYSLAKNDVVDEIYARIFAAPPEAHPAWPRDGWVPAGGTSDA